MQPRLSFSRRAPRKTAIALEGATAWIVHDAFDAKETAALARELDKLPHWRYREIVVAGRPCRQNRQSCALSTVPGLAYRYSGVDDADAPPMTPRVAAALARAAALVGHGFAPNYCLLNRYADGSEVVGWHADSTADLAPPHWIASVSIGATRRFEFRRRSDRTVVQRLELPDGCVVVMGPNVQRLYHHRIAPNARIVEPRFNLTFRQVRGDDEVAPGGSAGPSEFASRGTPEQP